MSEYSAIVSRDKSAWTVQCVEYPQAHTWAKNLVELRVAIKEAIILAGDLANDAIFSVELLGDESVSKDLTQALAIGNKREELLVAQQQIADHVNSFAQQLTNTGHSARDVAGALAISAGRVSQLVKK